MNRRDFLADVGRGMLVASVGAAAFDMGLAPTLAADDPKRLNFGKLEPLASLLQETPAKKLLPLLVQKLNDGVELRTLVGAAALANARTLGGHDYDGYHTFMALAPAFEMSRELPSERAALPVLKVLYRNAQDIEAAGGVSNEKLKPVDPVKLPAGADGMRELRDAVRKRETARAEGVLATMTEGKFEDAFNDLQAIVQEDLNVHRVVLPWRAWVTLDFTGREHALTLLRQSVRFCIYDDSVGHIASPSQEMLTKLFDQYKLAGKSPGKRDADDLWVQSMTETIATKTPSHAADAAAAALAEGFSPEAVGEAMSLAANWLLLTANPKGRTHGDSVGLHASDAANAWRNVARVSNARNTFASLICGAFHTAGQRRQNATPLPWREHLEKVTAKDAGELLQVAESAVKDKDQSAAAAAVHRYGELGHPSRAMFDMLLKYAISEDGKLHAEKYYRTVVEEFTATRPAFRWRHLVALARVTASEYGKRADGYDEACRLLEVTNP